ncbi:DUF3802 family protein [Thalassotalea piscium]|uniref:DUF3802 family protein n=1 Tax=Thalassotalea piscium TaxID=1230533 RepID=A0A7X0TUM3_9GAMM|nr:DUF3802 family protein [Thalassotalea piscium]MBB6544304.1 hypothetical protein [Thalassotalea piscium]
MVTDTEGYIHIVEYLTEHLSLFENSPSDHHSSDTVMAVIEQELSEQIMIVCNQNEELSFNQRNIIIREIDAIVYDLQEILSGVVNNKVSPSQKEFIKEFSLLIKNLFDIEVHAQFLS